MGVSLDLGFAGVALGLVPFSKKAGGEMLKESSVTGKRVVCFASYWCSSLTGTSVVGKITK